jgi:hypothetical protein
MTAMKAMVRSLRDGFRAVARHSGLVLLVLATNVGLALLLAVPFAILVERDLARTGASSGMMYGFDYDWWSRWDSQAQGFAADFRPDLIGTGFAFRNLDLLLRGQVPGGLFAGDAGPDAAILGTGVLYLLLQIFLCGGLLAVFRSPGGWTVRGLVHACGFYFGRLFRVSLLALAAAGLVFALDAPFAAWLDGLAREAVSERSALALTLGRRAALLVALVLVHMVSSYAKVILVGEERRSALLAFVSSAGFCARHLVAALGQYVVVAALGLGLLRLFAVADARIDVVGWKTQLVALALFQAFVSARIALRLGLLAAQLELHRTHSR